MSEKRKEYVQQLQQHNKISKSLKKNPYLVLKNIFLFNNEYAMEPTQVSYYMKKSKKKLSDFFRDQKFSSKQKQECLLLLSDEKIAWIIGNRPDDRFKITSFTSNILQISIL